MMEIGKRICNKVSEYINIRMGIHMKDSLFKIRNRERESSFIKMAVDMRVILSMVNSKVRE